MVFTCNINCLQDLKNAKSIVEWIAWAEPVYNFNPMIDEWCREAPKEVDFNIEAGTILTLFLCATAVSLMKIDSG